MGTDFKSFLVKYLGSKLWILSNLTKISSWGAISRFALLIVRRFSCQTIQKLLNRKPISKIEVHIHSNWDEENKKAKYLEEKTKAKRVFIIHLRCREVKSLSLFNFPLFYWLVDSRINWNKSVV